jgi:hypothetical protein
MERQKVNPNLPGRSPRALQEVLELAGVSVELVQQPSSVPRQHHLSAHPEELADRPLSASLARNFEARQPREF